MHGGPLSPILFNTVIDYITSKLYNTYDVILNNNTQYINYLAFADDLIITAKNEISLQIQVDLIN